MSTDIPIYVISLGRLPERRLSVQRQLDALNLKYQIIEAFDGHDFFSKDYRLKVVREFGMNEDAIEKNLSTWSSYAILFSHIKAYNLMIRNNIPLACILEDDIDICPVFPEILNNVQQFSWDILMLANHSDSVGKLINILINIMTHRSYRSVCRRLISHYIHSPRLSLRQHLVAMQCAFNIIKRLIKRRWHLYPNSIIRKSSFDINQAVINFRDINERESFWQYYASKMGAAFSHDKAFKHHITDNYYIASKLPDYCQGGMGYMLRLEAALRWKKEALTDKHGDIDYIPRILAERNDVTLSIVTPPCITALYSYLSCSARRN